MATILVIDDDGQLRAMIRQLLERNQHTVLEAVNGLDGLEKYRKQKADVVITDLIMPEKDGILTIQDLLMEFPSAKVLAISGGPRGNAAWLPIAKRVGALRVLKKPFTTEQLTEVVNEVLNLPQ